MRIYIAGPMTGRPGWNRAAFAEAEAGLAATGLHQPVSPVHDDDLNPDGSAVHEWAWYLRRDLRQLLDCDAVACLDGWEDSRGSALEVHVARALGMVVMPLSSFLLRAPTR